MEKDPIRFDVLHPQPLLIVISGPSGVGKDSVARELMRRDSNLDFAITTTAREIRENEKEGVDYYFVSTEKFNQMVDAGEFLENSLVYGQLKGVSRKEVQRKWAEGKDVILRIDFQGAMKFKALYRDTLMIFLLPTSEAELYQRLVDRGTETKETIELRMATTREEMQSLGFFDYLVYNPHGKMDHTVQTLEAIIIAEHHRTVQRKIII